MRTIAASFAGEPCATAQNAPAPIFFSLSKAYSSTVQPYCFASALMRLR